MDTPLAFSNFAGKKVLLGVTGSIACSKALDLTRNLTLLSLEVSNTLTSSARQFINPLAFEALGAVKVYTDMFGPKAEIYDHLRPGQQMDGMAIVPATANILAKLAHGLADDLLSSQALAFNKPIVLAPAMNPLLWNAQATQENWALLRNRGHVCLEPDTGGMACGDKGKGRLPRLDTIQLALFKALCDQDMAHLTVLVTLGPTREYWDPVRFWSNPSSGRMGVGLATAAWLRGATVHALCGPTELIFPDGVIRHETHTAVEMHTAAMDLWPQCDLACCSAAVADFRPESYGKEKFKKNTLEGELKIHFKRNPDILHDLGKQKNQRQKTVGFAAETRDILASAQMKLESKNADMIVANDVFKPGSGFGQRTNEAHIIDKTGRRESLPLLSKEDLAWRIWSWVLEL